MKSLLTPELQILMNAMSFVLVDDGLMSVEQDIFPDFDIDRLMKLVRFHKLRPILMEYDNHYKFLDRDTKRKLTESRTRQIQRNLKNVHELHSILDLLSSKGVSVLPMKGSLFVNAIYKNQQLREFGDIDILCKRGELLMVIEILESDGYSALIRQNRQISSQRNELVTLMLDFGYENEIKLKKEDVNIDLHWHFLKPHFGYHFPIEDFFRSGNHIEFYGKTILGPTPEEIFWMMLFHHGGAEHWRSLSHLADLICFLNTYGLAIDWTRIFEKAKTYRIHRIMLDGFWLLKVHLNYPLPDFVDSLLSGYNHKYHSSVLERWEESEWKTSKAFLLKHKIWIKSRINITGKIGYIRHRFNYFWSDRNLYLHPGKMTVWILIRDSIRFTGKLLRGSIR